MYGQLLVIQPEIQINKTRIHPGNQLCMFEENVKTCSDVMRCSQQKKKYSLFTKTTQSHWIGDCVQPSHHYLIIGHKFDEMMMMCKLKLLVKSCYI
ncbi:hypothetical protein DERP_013233 [Dermatophagoides pteronyssinus]|uniref:Uncharacterized protein n=1 Tax=Dermatophagoides pteronyssinus TaxID=6956 RepID=A0ABQ8IRI0_DERPT|nr:hypothetical protein DERP_013233 [Dermatophagoides pteronyssinus]